MAFEFKRGDARSFAQRYIIKGIRDGLSGNDILKSLRSTRIGEFSAGYRTETFYDDYNRYIQARKAPTLRGTKRFPSGVVTGFTYEAPIRGKSGFVYTRTFTGRNTETGERMTQTVAIKAAHPLLDLVQPQALAEALEGGEYNIELDEVQRGEIEEYKYTSNE